MAPEVVRTVLHEVQHLGGPADGDGIEQSHAVGLLQGELEPRVPESLAQGMQAELREAGQHRAGLQGAARAHPRLEGLGRERQRTQVRAPLADGLEEGGGLVAGGRGHANPGDDDVGHGRGLLA